MTPAGREAAPQPARTGHVDTHTGVRALAATPDACTIVTMDEVNSIAAGSAAKISPRKSGNPTECAFEDSRRAAVLVIRSREVQYAAEDEVQ